MQIITDPDQDPDSPKRFGGIRIWNSVMKGKKIKEVKGRKKKVSKRQGKYERNEKRGKGKEGKIKERR